MMTALSSFTLFTLIAIPGFVVTLLVVGRRYAIGLNLSAKVVRAVLLISLVASSVGFGIGHAVAEPRVTNLITNLIIFTVLMFSPTAFSRSRTSPAGWRDCTGCSPSGTWRTSCGTVSPRAWWPIRPAPTWW